MMIIITFDCLIICCNKSLSKYCSCLHKHLCKKSRHFDSENCIDDRVDEYKSIGTSIHHTENEWPKENKMDAWFVQNVFYLQ